MKLRDFTDAIKMTFLILSNPKQEFHELEKQSIESVVGYYLRMLLLVAIAAGIFNFLFSIIRALFLDITVAVDIQYLRMVNYSLGISFSNMFFYLFAGTFILFFISILISLFTHKLKYTELLKIMMYSMAPILLFGWIPYLPLPFIVWALFLFFIGLKTYKTASIKRNSIANRD